MKLSLFFCMILLILTSCTTTGNHKSDAGEIERILEADERKFRKGGASKKKAKKRSYKNDRESFLPTTALLPERNKKRLKLRKTARSLLGQHGKYITVNGRTFPNDCSGMVRAVYSAIGIDLMADASQFKAGINGVKIIYYSYKDKKWTNRGRTPRTGDLIFFNNTYDKNKNGKWDDPLTHVSMVTGIEKDGTIVYIHHVSRGVHRYRMNFNQKGVYKNGPKRMNDFLRRRAKGDKDRKKYLSDNLFYSFIDVLASKVAAKD